MEHPTSSNPESELEAFRQRWRQEVEQRNKGPETRHAESSTKPPAKQKQTVPVASAATTARRKDIAYYSEDVEPRAYHDLPNKEDNLKLGEEGHGHDRDVHKEPDTALEHYERAVDKEATGQLGDSLKHYRKAYKVCPSRPHTIVVQC